MSSQPAKMVLMDAAPKSAPTIARRILADAARTKGFWIGLCLITGLLLLSLIYPEVSSLNPMKMSVKEKFLPPIYMGDGWTWTHPLGTDQLGRDILRRCLIGPR